MNWLNIFKHLLPSGRAWRLIVDKMFRRFFVGLTGIGEDIKAEFDAGLNDLDPQLTRELVRWEKQWALPAANLTEQQRRDRLSAAWKAKGGQDPRYIQDTLQAAGFDVYVHEWWKSIPGRPTGGSVNGDVTPVARNPFDYLWDGVTPRQFVGDGHDSMMDGGDLAFENSQLDPPGYPLVNKVIVATTVIIGDGHDSMMDGGTIAADGAKVSTVGRKQYVIPMDSTKYPYFLYIGGQTFPNVASVPAGRKEEFEDLCLKICPLEQWLGILVTYT